ncbi:hypothetical protein [Pseudoalteromonas carrageenovora]|uniref:hypothetical protein n=1 Tax=Pseudoalteromonas carrageenovora TaxID=227 RepID=UPI0026E399CA|nr:hypothetical protein [Pseudoalteromonas carrageenovora]MDO6548989.1 hypothetical protein [Pseudoalteromonas carrageenovora]MDO6833551.1 hypothetical protein [Pseudoalteromonas carrageenovora]
MLTQEIEKYRLLYQYASKQGAYKKFNHHANFQRRREACSRKKLKHLHFYNNTPASKAPTKNLTTTPTFNVGVKLAHARN